MAKNEGSKAQSILEAAEKVFSTYGYEKATVDEIITLADVGKGTVYKYFGNKEQLFYKLVSDKNKSFVEELQKVVEDEAEFKDKLLAFFKVMIAFYKENSALWQIICFEMMNGHSGCMVRRINNVPTVVSRYNIELDEQKKDQMIRYHLLLESEFSILQRLLQKGMDEHILKGDDAEVATMYIFFGVAMCIFHPHDEIERMSVEEGARRVVDRFLYGSLR